MTHPATTTTKTRRRPPRRRRPRLLDLFCGAGGAGTGYHRAGFTVTGVDVEAQPEYPHAFIHADALEVLADPGFLAGFDAIHASPPCQHDSPASAVQRARGVIYPNHIPAVRAALSGLPQPWVIENVSGSGLHAPLVLCGLMFGLPILRHRRFETTLPVLAVPPHPRHRHKAMRNGVLPTPERPLMTITGRNGHHSAAWTRAAATAMDVEWINDLNGVVEAIPPAYTHHIGQLLIEHLDTIGAAA